MLQYLHLPFKERYEKRGILSYQDSLWSHTGQCDPGKAMLSSLGILYISTFKKEPIKSP